MENHLEKKPQKVSFSCENSPHTHTLDTPKIIIISVLVTDLHFTILHLRAEMVSCKINRKVIPN